MIYAIRSILFVFFLFIAFTSAFRPVFNKNEEYYRSQWEAFRERFNKAYLTASEDGLRYDIFKSNLRFIESHDAKAAGFTVAVNEFADLSSSEFSALYNGYKSGANRSGVLHEMVDVPAADTVDWRTKGSVTHVKNQGQCGSCWSFSATGSIEGANQIKKGSLVSFSEQNLVDCSQAEGNEGCNGGLMDYAFKYVIQTRGLDTESSYPYEARQGQCRYKPANSGGTISGFRDIPAGSESALQNAIQTTGPVSVAIDASHSSFQFYSGGVYYEPRCSAQRLDHGVLAVGFGTASGQDYYIVKNSWGASWGSSGYINMARNRNNNCGIATESSYPTI